MVAKLPVQALGAHKFLLYTKTTLKWEVKPYFYFIIMIFFFHSILCISIFQNSNNLLSNLSHRRKKLSVTIRAVKKFLSSRLIMNSKWLWNLHQRHKFLRAKASRDILTFRVSEMAFLGVFKRFFPPRTPCCFVRTNARLGTMSSKCPRRSKTSDGAKRSTDLNLFK